MIHPVQPVRVRYGGEFEDKKKQSAIRTPFSERMVGVVELESTTSTMSTWRSNQLSYTPSFQD